MEAKLREYRALRRRKELIEMSKETLENTKQKISNLLTPKFFTDMNNEKKDDEVVLFEEELPPPDPIPLIYEEENDPENLPEEKQEEEEESWLYFIVKWSIYGLVWLSLYMYFLKIGFGAVFFVISALIGICLNTRTGKKRKGEVSAYSVFNENCVSIDGTLKAEQFEKEIRYGAAGMNTF